MIRTRKNSARAEKTLFLVSESDPERWGEAFSSRSFLFVFVPVMYKPGVD
jgi:hypothetical protein